MQKIVADYGEKTVYDNPTWYILSDRISYYHHLLEEHGIELTTVYRIYKVKEVEERL